ncbi:CAAX amino terminal protease self- immunity [Enhygromyxa salina]|uniref:CAAX amino terminal protease self-immunity n=1 Tax=Enhygromyxa salina TaxID=215803 RepID=A0A2S9XG19_9BACT|nr:CPBP family intramembrane glutamic endopeptidase [Enhygromyxa salina]PRP91700.1 CAAX amino terminal protease self- immunity [Enhygromyxa salina]
MSKPAQRPPDDAKPLELVMHASTEVLLLALSFMVGMAALIALMAVGVIPDPEGAAWSGIVAGPVLIGTAGAAYLGFERLLGRSEGPARPLVSPAERKRAGVCVLIALAGVVVALAGSAVLGFIQEQLLETAVEEQEAIVELVARGQTWELALLAVSAVVLAPLTEEWLFRHMFFRRLLHRSGLTLAWILPALAFSLAHWNPVGVAIYVWLGLVFAACYLLSGRLWVAMAVHAGHNAVAFSLLLWPP